MSKCNNCDKYDFQAHSCPIFCDVIRHTLEDVRADERRKFAKWLEALSYTKDAPIKADVYIPDLIYDYEKEQKNE